MKTKYATVISHNTNICLPKGIVVGGDVKIEYCFITSMEESFGENEIQQIYVLYLVPYECTIQQVIWKYNFHGGYIFMVDTFSGWMHLGTTNTVVLFILEVWKFCTTL